jgi:hypothetical protein
MNQPSIPASVEAVIIPRAHDVGGFEVRRALPAREKQMIGPFIFFDQMGPGEFSSLPGAASTFGPTRILVCPLSPICSTARSCTETLWVRSFRSFPAT